MQLVDIYRQALIESPDKKAVVCSDTFCTYRELDENIIRYSQTLTALGVKKGDRVGLLMPNCLEIIYAYFACFRIGAIAVPSSYYSKTPEIIYEANHCQINIYLVHQERAHILVGVQENTPSLEAVYVVNSTEDNSFISFTQQLNKYGETKTLTNFAADKNYPATVMYTSGSTGKPKGVTHTHESFVDAAINRCQTFRHTAQDSFMTTSYICHGAAPTVVLLPMFYAGGTAFFLSHFTAEHFLNMMIKHHVNFAAGAPAQWREIIDCPINSKQNFSSLRYATSGGSVVPFQLQKDFQTLTGVPLTASLGMTECGGYMTTPPSEKAISGSLGKPIYKTEARLIDRQGKDVPTGATGEIIVRSNSMMKGYWNDPGNTAKAFTDDWFHTGDIGKQDKSGNFYFCGRLKETIVVDTGNVTPGEVEEVLNQHPEIEQSIVVGVLDEHTEQAIFSYIQLKDGGSQPSKQELSKYAARYLATRKIPKYWHFIDEFEVSGIADKIDRKKLAKEALTLIRL